MQQNNTPARRPKTDINDLRKLLEKFRDQIAMALPRHVTPERMIRVALTAFGRTPRLAECSAISICGALVQASILGLEPDGMSGEAFLIPYWNGKIRGYDCQMQPGYKGIVKLARNSGEYSLIDAQPVHESDTFEFQKGSETFWVHKWDPRKPRGPIYGYWAGYRLKDGGANFEFMSVAEIEAHRDQYSQGAYQKERGELVLDAEGKRILTGPWRDSPDWMYRKTPLLQALKLGPKSYQLRQAMTYSETADAGTAQSFIDIPKELAAPLEEDTEQQGDDIPQAKAKEDAGAQQQKQNPDPKSGPQTDAPTLVITETQGKRIMQIAADVGWQKNEVLKFLEKDYKVKTLADVRAVDYDQIVEIIQTGGGVPK